MKQLSPDLKAVLQQGIQAVKTGNRSLALKHLTTVLKQHPEQVDALLWLACVLPKAEDSLRVLDRVQALDPDNPHLENGRRWAEKRLAKVAQQAPAKSPPSPPKIRSPFFAFLDSPNRSVLVGTSMVLLLLLVGLVTLLLTPPQSLAELLPTTTISQKIIAPAAPITYIDQPAADAAAPQVEPPLADVSSPLPTTTDADAIPAIIDETVADNTETTAQVEALPDSRSQVEQALTLNGATPILNITDLIVNPQPAPVDEALLAYKPTHPGEKWIEVNVTTQEVTAWEGNVPVMHFIVSTGLPHTPTVLGEYRIYQKLVSTRMIGPGYDLPGVPYTMYFHRGYALHGAYWHTNFGQPMSHGCVNFSPEEAKTLFDWAEPVLPSDQSYINATTDNPGTLVVVHR